MEQEEKELLNVGKSFAFLKGMNIARHVIIPVNSDISNFESEIEKLGFPCWIKINSEEHKFKLGGVKKCYDLKCLKDFYLEFRKSFPDKELIVQEHVKGVEVIAGIKHDKTFGKILVVGSGGTFTEIVKDVDFRVCPVEKDEIEKAIKGLKIDIILEKNKANISALVEQIKIFSDLKIEEADLNPIIVNKEKAVVVDARIRV